MAKDGLIKTIKKRKRTQKSRLDDIMGDISSTRKPKKPKKPKRPRETGWLE